MNTKTSVLSMRPIPGHWVANSYFRKERKRILDSMTLPDRLHLLLAKPSRTTHEEVTGQDAQIETCRIKKKRGYLANSYTFPKLKISS